ncbi:uncharacterized protein [Dermacentor albipictus]|uniref:uncharacterized protein isoform X2 n=1 Tax=Dermacentor albipictus TaxID=60249 RepID=UPI0031FDABDE
MLEQDDALSQQLLARRRRRRRRRNASALVIRTGAMSAWNSAAKTLVHAIAVRPSPNFYKDLQTTFQQKSTMAYVTLAFGEIFNTTYPVLNAIASDVGDSDLMASKVLARYKNKENASSSALFSPVDNAINLGPSFCVLPSSCTTDLLLTHIVNATCRARRYAFCIRKGLVPDEVSALFGPVKPSWGHVKRLCRLMRSELWRQVRLFQDWLRLLCYVDHPGWLAARKLASLMKTAAQLTEHHWRCLLNLLLSCLNNRDTTQGSKRSVTVLGNVSLPENVTRLLQKGPKYGLEPGVPAHELIATNRKLAMKTRNEEDRDRCLLEGVDCLRKCSTNVLDAQNHRNVLNGVVSLFKRNNLMLVQADKETGFVVLPKGMFNEKAQVAINKNFEPIKKSAVRVKTKFINFCRELNLDKLARDIANSRGSSLNAFFTAKTHKPDIPFRTIVSEEGSWQINVSRFLQKHLKTLALDDPFLTKKSTDVALFLESTDNIGFGFSVDVQDLFYSVPQDQLLLAVRECVEANGEVSFRNSTGLSVDNFISLLQFYLKSTFIVYDNLPFLQRNGICIGSCVAPILCDIFLAKVDRFLDRSFLGGFVLKVFRYVDDFLVLLKKQTAFTYLSTVGEVLNAFDKHALGLNFTHELPDANALQFLDLRLTFDENHVCWGYFPRAKKDLLPYDSAHSKTVKRAIASHCLESSLQKSCPHLMQTSFENQASRLVAAGFPHSVLIAVSETLLQKLKLGTRVKDDRRKTDKPLVVPYLHKTSHSLKKVANRHGVSVVFSAPNKLAQLCPRICNSKKRGCQLKHEKPFIKCSKGVVYAIPLKCGKAYIGQTGRCINERLGEHARNLSNLKDKYAHLVAHVIGCTGCEARLGETKILGKSADETARVSLETFYIHKYGSKCVSTPSVSLFAAELQFLEAAAF